MTTSPVAPGSFAPLDGRNGVPGDAGDVSALARRYANTAAEIEAQAANLRRLTSQASGGWKGQAGERFAEAAGDLAERISRARRRYEAAAEALSHFAGRLADVQAAAYGAVRDAQDADDEVRRLRSRPPTAAPTGAEPAEVAAADAERRAHDRAVTDATTRLSSARQAYGNAKDDYSDAASDAARMLRDGRADDGLADSWWDRNAGWIDTVLTVIGVVVLVIAVVALVISLFVPGLNLAVIGLAGTTVVSVLNGAGAVLTAVMLAGHVGLAATDNGDWSDVWWDLAGLATFGLGFAVAPAARAVGAAASRIGSGIAAGRAGRAAFSAARGGPRLLWELGRRVPPVRTLMSVSPRLRAAFLAADGEAAAARSAVATLTGDPTAVGARILAFGDRDMAAVVTLVDRVHDAVPGSLRLATLESAVRTGAFAWGPVVQGRLFVQGIQSTYDDLWAEPREAAQTAAEVAETLRTWSLPLVHVR